MRDSKNNDDGGGDLLGCQQRVFFPCSWGFEVWWLWCWGGKLHHHGCENGRWLHYQAICLNEVMPTRVEVLAHLEPKIGGGPLAKKGFHLHFFVVVRVAKRPASYGDSKSRTPKLLEKN